MPADSTNAAHCNDRDFGTSHIQLRVKCYIKSARRRKRPRLPFCCSACDRQIAVRQPYARLSLRVDTLIAIRFMASGQASPRCAANLEGGAGYWPSWPRTRGRCIATCLWSCPSDDRSGAHAAFGAPAVAHQCKLGLPSVLGHRLFQHRRRLLGFGVRFVRPRA